MDFVYIDGKIIHSRESIKFFINLNKKKELFSKDHITYDEEVIDFQLHSMEGRDYRYYSKIVNPIYYEYSRKTKERGQINHICMDFSCSDLDYDYSFRKLIKNINNSTSLLKEIRNVFKNFNRFVKDEDLINEEVTLDVIFHAGNLDDFIRECGEEEGPRFTGVIS